MGTVRELNHKILTGLDSFLGLELLFLKPRDLEDPARFLLSVPPPMRPALPCCLLLKLLKFQFISSLVVGRRCRACSREERRLQGQRRGSEKGRLLTRRTGRLEEGWRKKPPLFDNESSDNFSGLFSLNQSIQQMSTHPHLQVRPRIFLLAC